MPVGHTINCWTDPTFKVRTRLGAVSMTNPADLEITLLKAIANARSDDWLPLSIGGLRNRMREFDGAAADETINRFIDAIASLGVENVLLIRKRAEGGRPVPFDFQRQNDDGYTDAFFARGDFELKLTHEGRKRITETPAQTGGRSGPEVPHHDRVYMEDLAARILDILGKRFPNATMLPELKALLPEFSSVNHESWLTTIDGLYRDGQVDCKILRSGIDSIDDVGPLRISQQARREQHTRAASQSPLDKQPGTKIFIGHGNSPLWKELKDFLFERLHLDWDEFNREAVAGLSTKERLQAMLDHAKFAFLVLTAEDEHPSGALHARENVIHELGLFQGRLGFERAIVLLEQDCVEYSNIHGLTQIRFPKADIKAVFEDIRRVLERENIIT